VPRKKPESETIFTKREKKAANEKKQR